jgi:hypothetical protein
VPRKTEPYTKESIEFWRNDPRVRFTKDGKKTSMAARMWLFGAGQIARECLSEVLPKHWSVRNVGECYDVDPKTSTIAFRIFQENSLVDKTPEGCLIVWGVQDRHGALHGWRDNPYPHPGEELVHSRVEESRVEEIKKKDKAAPPRSSKKKSQETAKPFNYDGYILGKIRLSWKHYFGSAENPRFDWVRDRCRDLEVAWWWVFKYAQGHNAKTPREYVSWILRPPDDPEHPEKTERPWPDEPATSYVKCEGDAIDEAKKSQARRGICC